MFERPVCVHGLAVALSLAVVGCFNPVGNNASEASTGPGTGGETTGGTDAPTSASGVGTTDVAGTTGEPTTTGVSATTTAATTATDTGDSLCGNGMVDLGEECDDGEGNGPSAQCTPECLRAVCGDDYVCDACSPVEECDDANDMPGDGCENECTVAKCGDGVVGMHEECDPPGAECGPRCTLKLQRLFVTFDKYAGAPGGLAGADLLCRTLGRTKYTRKREFVAWLSTDTPLSETAATRIGSSTYPYQLPSNKIVAVNTVDLLDGMLLLPIDETEQGTQATADTSNCVMAGVWTGTAPDGTITAGATCGGWAEERVKGTVGTFTATDGAWTAAGTCEPCGAEKQRFYCIEKVVP